MRRLTSFGHDPAWFPGGRRVVFATTATGTPYARLGTKSELWTVDTATGATARLFGGDAMQPAVSPHGLRVAFWALREGGSRRDIATIPLAPRPHPATPVPVTDDAAFDWSPYWSDDGRYLCFASDRGGTMNLWRVRIDEETGRPLAPPEPIPVPARSAGPFRGSVDGRTVVYQAGTAGFDLERIPLDARGFPAGPGRPLLTDSEGMGEPRLSPSGELLAFASWRAGEDLWVVGTDGQGLRRVTAGPFRDRSPSFTADGAGPLLPLRPLGQVRDLADAARRERPGRGHPPGRPPALPRPRLPRRPLSRAPEHPLGRRPPARRPSARCRLARPAPAAAEGIRFEVTSFSADGRLAAGHGIAHDETYRGLWLWDRDAKRYEPLGAEGSCPQLVRDGRRIYFLRQRALFEPATVALLDLGTREVHDVLPIGRENAVVALAAAPDGTALYVVRERSRADIWLMRLP